MAELAEIKIKVGYEAPNPGPDLPYGVMAYRTGNPSGATIRTGTLKAGSAETIIVSGYDWYKVSFGTGNPRGLSADKITTNSEVTLALTVKSS
ncbi:MAG TPA: hypothetical protein VKB86_11515 [Pyrinomonadaceae bacterium]|nr:hypothetical protein [Pyrinomonadaceae bacterium]